MSGAVYKPTTVQYESNSPPDRLPPITFLGGYWDWCPCSLGSRGRKMLNVFLISCSLLLLPIGLVMIIKGALGYSETTETMKDFYLHITIMGALLVGMSIIVFVIFLRITGRWLPHNGKDHLCTSGGQNLTVNPSTDLLVTAQYAPVSEVVYEPKKAENFEQSKLMPHERNKDISNEDADRMVENDPRIVLRPLNAAINDET